MIISFGDRTTEDIFHGFNTKQARRIPKELRGRIQDKLELLNACRTLEDLRVPPANRSEKLSGELAGFFSIRVNEQYRIVFRFEDGNCALVRCTDYH